MLPKTITWVSLDWPEIARIIKARKPQSVYAFVTGLEDTTGGYISRNGKIQEYSNRPTPWLYATHGCGREIRIRMTFASGEVEEITCETLECDWELGEYWPAVARKLMTEGEGQPKPLTEAN